MAEEGFTFFLSANKVWLTKTVPLDYLRRESNDGSDLNDIIGKLRNHNSFSDEDENNTIWSITAELFGLDYSNSEYNPLKDERITKKLSSYGIRIGDEKTNDL